MSNLFDLYPSFTSVLGPLAQQAGSALGVAPSTILSQWALESGNGQAPNAVSTNNYAGIMIPGSKNPQVLQTFDSPQAFEQAYVNLIQSGYPGALNTGSDINAFVGGLTANPNHLYTTTDPTTYANSLAGIASEVPGSLASGGAPSGMASTASGNSSGSQAQAPSGSLFQWIYAHPLDTGVLIVVALATVGIIVSTVWNSGKAIAVKV